MKSSLKLNYLYNLLYRVVTLVTPLITAPYISRVLGAEGIGQYSYTYAVSHYFLIFAELGVSDYGNREIAKVRDNVIERNKIFNEIFSLQVLLSIVISVLYFAYAWLLADFKMLVYMQGLNVLSAFFDITWVLFGMELFLATTIRNIFVKIASVVMVIVFVNTPNDVWIYTIIMAAGTLIGQISVWPILCKYMKFSPAKFQDIIKHLKPNLILFLPVVANNLLGYFDKIMIGKMSGDAELGCYDNAEKLLSIPNSLVTALGTVMLPRVSNSVALGQKEKVKNMTQKSMLFVLFATNALAFGISAVSEEFVPFFFGPGFELVIPLIYILASYIVFVSWSNVLKTQCLLPNNKDKIFVVCLITGAVLNVVLNAALIPKYGSVGAAVATTLSEFLIAIMETISISEEIELKKYIEQGVPFICFGVIMFMSIYWIKCTNVLITVIVKICLGASIYLLCSTIYIFFNHKDVWKSLVHKRRHNL